MKPLRLVVVNTYDKQLPAHRIAAFHVAFDSLQEDLEWRVVPYTDFRDIDPNSLIADALILSGSELNLSDASTRTKMGPLTRFLREYTKPVLGICFGHQLLGYVFGFPVGPMKALNAEFNIVISLQIDPAFPLLESPTSEIRSGVLEVEVHHHEEIKANDRFNDYFTVFARTPACAIHVISHNERPLFGVQFHPETQKSATASLQGRQLLQNFVYFSRDYKKSDL